MTGIIDLELSPTEEDWIHRTFPSRSRVDHEEIEVGIDIPTDDFNIRPAVPRGMRREVLYNSNRACCVCRKKPKAVYLHHINNDRYSHSHANLIVLCTLHHDMVHGRNGHKKSLTQYTLRQYKRTWESEVKKNREAVTVKIVNKDIEIELFGAWRTVRGKKIYIGDASGSYGSGNCSDASGGIVDIAFDKMTAKDFGSMEKEWGSMEFGEEFAKYAKGGDSRKGMVVRDSKGKVQGACLFTKSGDRVNLHYVETNPANRGKKKGLSGIGSNILARLCAEIPSGGSLMLTATTDSLPFYKKIGMETMGNVARFTHANGQTFSRKIGIMPKSSMSELRRKDVFDLEDALPRGLLAGKESKKKKLANEEIEVIISTTDVLAPPTPGTDGKSSNTKGISTSLPALSVPIILNRRF